LADNIFTRIGRAFRQSDDGADDALDLGGFGAPPEHIEPDWDSVDGVAKAAPTGTIGSTGASTVGGFILSTERGPKLQGIKRFEAFAEMVADTSIVAAGVRLFLALLKKAEWAVVPAEGQEENGRAKEIAEAVESMMYDMTSSWAKIVGQLAMYRFDGFRILEWTAKQRDDGQIGMLDVEIRPPRTIVRWDLDPGGTVLGVWQQTPDFKEVFLPRGKVVYGVDDTLTEHPEGMGLYRHLVLTARRLKAFHDLEEIGFDTDLRGIPVAYGPLAALDKMVEDEGGTEASKAKRTQYRKPLIDFINSHIRNRRQGLMFDSETYRSSDERQTPSPVKKWSVELLQGESSSFEAMTKAIVRLNQEMARILGVEHLLLGADGGGSLALGRAKVDVLFLTVQATQSELVEILERDWLGPIAELNGWEPDLVPSLAVAELRGEDVAAVTEALDTMARAGAVLQPDDPAINVVRDMVNLPHVPDELMARDADLLGDDPDDPDAPIDRAPEPGMNKRVNVHWIRSRRSKMRQKRVAGASAAA
jgi:hypothetical protein